MHRWLAAGLLLAGSLPAAAQNTPAPERVSAATYAGWMRELSNQGRWGAQDQLGTLNLITPDVMRRATGLVRAGVSVSMSLTLGRGQRPYDRSPLRHQVFESRDAGQVLWMMDSIVIAYHGWGTTHMDALSHTAIDGQVYNGVPRESLRAEGGYQLGVHQLRNGIVSRGVLVDIPKLRNVPYLEPGTAITADELERWERANNVRIGAGDVLLVRTGRWAREEALGPWPFQSASAGLHPSVARWLKARDVAAIGCDGVTDVFPSLVDGPSNPIHQLLIVAIGMPMFDNLELEAVAREAAARRRPTFLFVSAPLPLLGGTGSPVNPLAIF